MWLKKGAWTSPFCYVSKVLFLSLLNQNQTPLVPGWERPFKGSICKFHAKYCSALRDLLSSNYMLASIDLAFVPRWAIQQGYQIGQKYIFVETRRCLPGWAICVHVRIHDSAFYQWSSNQRTAAEMLLPKSYREQDLILKKWIFSFS